MPNWLLPSLYFLDSQDDVEVTKDLLSFIDLILLDLEGILRGGGGYLRKRRYSSLMETSNEDCKPL